MTVVQVKAPQETALTEAMVLCSDATYNIDDGTGTGDPTEIALVAFGASKGLEKSKLDAMFERVDEKPFDSNRKRMSTLNRYEAHYRVHTKGAIDQLLKVCTQVLKSEGIQPLNDSEKQKILKDSEAMSDEALRVLAAAYKDVTSPIPAADMESDLIFIGFVGMIDPPREEVKASIAAAKNAGITPHYDYR